MSEEEADHAMEQLHEEVAKVAEELKHKIHQQQIHKSQDRNWINQVAVSTGLVSALADTRQLSSE
jgi:hypothetical protein